MTSQNYYLKVMPTVYSNRTSTVVSNELSVNEVSRRVEMTPFGQITSLPGIFFIYDITISFCLNAADASKTDYEILTELNDFLQKHSKAVLYLSEDRELRKSERYETNSPLILDCLRRFVKQELAQYPEPPQQKIFTIDLLYRNYTETLSTAQQQVLMYRLFKVLFDTLKLPELRAKRGEVVSYSKQLLVSRIIYFCRLTANESFTVDSSSLKGVLKQYGNTDFNQLEPRVYTGGLRLPKEEGE